MKTASLRIKSSHHRQVKDKPYIKSYRVNILRQNLNCLPIEWCEKLLEEISLYFDMEGVIPGHIKGILLMDTYKASFSVTHTGKVSTTKYDYDEEVSIATCQCGLFKFDVLSYVEPRDGYEEYLVKQWIPLVCEES